MPSKAKTKPCAALFNAHRGANALYKAAVRVRDSRQKRVVKLENIVAPHPHWARILEAKSKHRDAARRADCRLLAMQDIEKQIEACQAKQRQRKKRRRRA